MNNPIIMHINYCEQGQEITELCRKAAAWGFDGIEFRRRRIGKKESRKEYLAALEKGVRDAGIEHVLFGYPGPLLLDPDSATREREVEEAVAFYRHVAERFGVKTVNLLTGQLENPDKNIPYSDYTKHGSFIATEKHWDWQVAGCRALADGLEDLDILFGFETHMVYMHDTVEATMELVENVDRPAIGVNLDYGNIVCLPDPPSLEQALATVKRSLHYVHLKNSTAQPGTPGRLATALGEGDINNRHFLRLLEEIGYEGPICLEAPRAGDREWYAQQDLAYIRKVLAADLVN